MTDNHAHIQPAKISRAELARQLGVSRTYVTLLMQGRRQPGWQLANKINELRLTAEFEHVLSLSHALVGKRGLEPRCLAAHDPKSCSSASSDTPPDAQPILTHQAGAGNVNLTDCIKPIKVNLTLVKDKEIL